MKSRLIVAALIIFGSCGAEMCGQEVTQASAPSRVNIKIYLQEFAGSAEPVTAGPTNLTAFVNSYVYLRLSQMANASIMSEPPSSCGLEPNALRRMAQQAAPTNSESPSFYTVRGTLEKHPQAQPAQAIGDELVITYEVLKTVRCQPQVLLHRGEPISQSRFLDSMSVIADAIAFRVGQDAAKRIQVDVRTVTIDRSGPDEAEFARSLTSYLVKALATTDDLQPNNADNGSSGKAEYVLEARVSSPRSANLLKGFARNTQISLYVLALSQGDVSGCSTNPHCYTLSPTPIRGTSNQSPQMFASAADIALKGISDVRYAREAGLPKDYSAEQAVERATQLLCEGSATNNCVPQPDVAISVLQKAPRNSDTLEPLGRAQYLSGKYADAAESFTASIRATASMPLETALRLNLSAGMAWYMAQNYNNAANSFDAAAQMIADNPGLHSYIDFNVPRALSHRFKGERLEAVDMLLHPVEPVTKAEALQIELEHIVGALTPNELPQAIQMLEKDAQKNRSPLAQAYESEARTQISQGHNSQAEATLQKALSLQDQQHLPALNYLLSVTQFWLLEGSGPTGEKKSQYQRLVERLDPIVAADPTGQEYGPLTLQLEICSDYLGDQECLRRTMGYLERAKAKELPPGIALDLIELQVLDRSYTSAAQRLESMVKGKTLEPRLKTVANFYQVWTELAQGNEGRAEHYFRDWQESLKRMRKLGAVNWDFGGAARALEPANNLFLSGSHDTLVAMMNAMQDEKAPAATFHY